MKSFVFLGLFLFSTTPFAVEQKNTTYGNEASPSIDPDQTAKKTLSPKALEPIPTFSSWWQEAKSNVLKTY